jgi:hypothetical protein
MINIKIGQLAIQIKGLEKKYFPENILKFQHNSEYPIDITYTFHIDGNHINLNYPIIYQTKDIIVLKKNDYNEIRILKYAESNIPYAIYEEINNEEINVYINPPYLHHLKSDTIFMSLLGLEKHESFKNFYILHCSYIQYNNQAILFSGPSGIGKSTHSTLWKKVFTDKVQLINGDRSLINIDKNIIYANGWPVCGSSNICLNKRNNVAGIVFLLQGKDNNIIQESYITYLKRFIQQTTINTWNKQYTNAAITFIEKIISLNRCCTYSCNITEEAVINLYNHFEKERWIY